jgi:hypothetical protein
MRKPGPGWRGNGRLGGLTLKQVREFLIERDPDCVRAKRDWTPVMEQALRVVNSYDTKMTLRQLFYQLISHEPSRSIMKNSLGDYNYLSRKTAEARRDGWFPDLIDQTSEILVAQHFKSPDDARDYIRSIYRRDRTEGQEVTIYLAVEKAGIQAQLWSWFADLGLPILALGGYGSQTYKDDIRSHVHQHIYVNGERVDTASLLKQRPHRPAVLVYARDHDASGDDIFRDLVQRTDPTARLSDDYTTVTRSRTWKAVHRIALTAEQAAGLPQNPGKDTDTRADGFMERHGYDDNIQVELDALAPDVLRGLYQSAVDLYWDADAYEAVMEREREERDELSGDGEDDDYEDDPDTVVDM